MASTGRVSRLAAEFVVIVAGVLSALAVDEWRETRQEHLLGAQLLESLILDVQLDSADFAALPRRAIRRIRSAEVILQNLAPDHPRSTWVVPALDTLGAVPNPASDSELISGLIGLVITSDFDVAQGAYREFSGGSQRLIEDPELRRAIHEYYYLVESLTKFDLLMSQSVDELRRQAHRQGIGQGDADADWVRARLEGPESGPFFAAVRTLQSDSWGQWELSTRLLVEASALLTTLRGELDGQR